MVRIEEIPDISKKMHFTASTISNFDGDINGHLVLERGFCVKFELITSVLIEGKKNRDVRINYIACKPVQASHYMTFSNKDFYDANKLFQEILLKMKSYYAVSK